MAPQNAGCRQIVLAVPWSQWMCCLVKRTMYTSRTAKHYYPITTNEVCQSRYHGLKQKDLNHEWLAVRYPATDGAHFAHEAVEAVFLHPMDKYCNGVFNSHVLQTS